MKANGSGLPVAQRQHWVIRLAVAVFASLIAAILGPFSTYENFTFVERLLYWGGLIIGLVFPAYAVRSVVYRTASGSPLRRDLIAAGAVALVVGPLVWAFNVYGMGFDLTSAFFFEHVAIVALVCLVTVSIRAYLRMSIRNAQDQVAANVVAKPVMTEGQAAFVRRLEPEKRGFVLRVSADDHQVEVWTDQGGSRLRLRFGDALEELTEFDGTRIHRSHWVAYSEIISVVPDGRRHTAKLSCGTQLPVSPSGLKALKEAGISVR